MALLPIHRFPENILAKHASPVDTIDGKIAALLNNMADTMYSANGIGLAANQVGTLDRVIVLDTDHDNRGKKLLKLVNPAIAEAEGEIISEEGCLSVVDYTAEIQRAARVLVRGWTIDQKEIEIEAEGLQAICLQHEIDHLDGTLFIDHISRLKRELYRKRLRKQGTDSGSRSNNASVPSI